MNAVNASDPIVALVLTLAVNAGALIYLMFGMLYRRHNDKQLATTAAMLDMRYRRITLVAKAGGERMTIDTALHFTSQNTTFSTGSDVFIVETISGNVRGPADLLVRGAPERLMPHGSRYCIGLAATGQFTC